MFLRACNIYNHSTPMGCPSALSVTERQLLIKTQLIDNSLTPFDTNKVYLKLPICGSLHVHQPFKGWRAFKRG